MAMHQWKRKMTKTDSWRWCRGIRWGCRAALRQEHRHREKKDTYGLPLLRGKLSYSGDAVPGHNITRAGLTAETSEYIEAEA